jgi:hypothetical protein
LASKADKGKASVGVKIVESKAYFILSFWSYDDNSKMPVNSTNSSLESNFTYDQLTDRILLKDMGHGVKEIRLEFENPIVVT